jgi:hypothetical protein
MKIRIFQVVIPLIALFVIWLYIGRLRNGKSTLNEIFPTLLFLVAMTIFVIIPDPVSDFLRKIVGMESNINAIMFFGMGLLFLVQLNLYSGMRKQEKEITKLTRELAISEFEREK